MIPGARPALMEARRLCDRLIYANRSVLTFAVLLLPTEPRLWILHTKLPQRALIDGTRQPG